MVLPFQLWYLQHTPFPWDAPIPSLQLSLADVSWSWHHQRLGTFSAIQASLSRCMLLFLRSSIHASFTTLKPEPHGWCRQVWLLPTWNVARSFNLLLLFRSWKFLSFVHFTSWNIVVWGLSLRVPFPLSHWPSDLSWNFSSLSSQIMPPTLHFLVLFCSSNCMFYISFDPLPVFYKICIRVVTNNHWTELKTGCLELSSVKVIRANI